MRLMRWHRCNGDCLSVRFNPDGQLCTAILYATGRQRNVAQQLPGLRESNAATYLTYMGYSLEVDPAVLAAVEELGGRLVKISQSLESVRRTERGFVLTIVDTRFLSYACPALLFSVEYDSTTRAVKPMKINSRPSFEEFQKAII